MTNFNRRVYEIVCRIPPGRVMSYGQVARLAGNAHASRAVGYALHQTDDEDHVPCQAEGVVFTAEEKVDMALCRWTQEEAEESLWW